jgi:hypothetical protein
MINPDRSLPVVISPQKEVDPPFEISLVSPYGSLAHQRQFEEDLWNFFQQFWDSIGLPRHLLTDRIQ